MYLGVYVYIYIYIYIYILVRRYIHRCSHKIYIYIIAYVMYCSLCAHASKIHVFWLNRITEESKRIFGYVTGEVRAYKGQ
jgi:hypothetical protein